MGIHVVSYSHGSIHSAWRQKEQKSTSLSAHNSNSSIDGVAGYAECDRCAELLLNPSPITVGSQTTWKVKESCLSPIGIQYSTVGASERQAGVK